MTWCVYILSSDTCHRTYVGVTVDRYRRLKQHNGIIAGGAKATRTCRPWTLHVIHDSVEDRGTAQKLEAEIKKMSRNERVELISRLV